MPTPTETIKSIIGAPDWDQRIARLRLIPHNHGTNDHPQIYAEIAKNIYVPDLTPDFAYAHESEFYAQEYFASAYDVAVRETNNFVRTSSADLKRVLHQYPKTLLVFRTITGLTKQEFAHSTSLVANKEAGERPISASKVDSMEQRGSATSEDSAAIVARTLTEIMDGSLYGNLTGEVISKQAKPDTLDGWKTVQNMAQNGVPYSMLLHQRHYGGAFRQLLDATSTKRGDLIEDAVETLFQDNGVFYIRTGSSNQSEVAERFQVRVTPAPDFVVYDNTEALRAILECKIVNDGGTARDKALRFERLRDEASRLGGIPLFAVLGGLGWQRANDALGPVVRDTDGRVFTLKTLPSMITVYPFPQLRILTP
jgi:hypothetical protein